jgi:uncharacterized protein (TIGR02594 family)
MPMQQIIDVDSDVSDFASGLANLGVKTVIRYYNNNNTASHPTKCLTRPELKAWHDAGLSVAVVFEQRGGAAGDITDLTKETGTRDAQQALQLATGLEQPERSAIYFAVDFDFIKSDDLQKITDYFREVRRVLANKYLVGVYGSGMVGRILKTASLVDHIWLSASIGFSGTEQALREGNFTLFQRDFDKPSPIGGFKFDGNILNSSFESFGQFVAGSVQPTPRGVGAAALFKVTARSGLNLRAGPGDNFQVLDTVPVNTIVTGIGREGDWIKVDLEGDGQHDGFMFEHFLQAVSGGLPLDPGPSGSFAQPIDVARAEMNLAVTETPDESNARILLFNATTAGGEETSDTPWCSSFVNYCVTQVPAVAPGTNSKQAQSWHLQHWHQDVTHNPTEGDIVVFERRQGSGDGPVLGGHVGFFISRSQDEATFQILGGNQHKTINISSFPANGVSGSEHFKLLSIRRG